MAAFALALLLLSFIGTSSCGATWCVCKDGSDAVLQKTLDYACGAGADCNPLHQNGRCFQPNTVRAHCSYAVNSYFQKKGQTQEACVFAGTATVVTSDPSSSGCAYPSSASAVGTGIGTGTGTGTTPVSTSPTMGTTPSSTGTPSTTTGTTTSGTTPYGSTTPGVLGGMGSGMGPSGSGMSNDESHGGLRLVDTSLFSMALFSAFMMLWWG